jgi:hypothetical protein
MSTPLIFMGFEPSKNWNGPSICGFVKLSRYSGRAEHKPAHAE